MNRLEKYLTKAILSILLIAVITFKIFPITSYGDTDLNNIIKLNIVTDKSEYTSGDIIDTDIKITNYNDTFSGTVTTMVIELAYDESILEVDMASMKKIADDNGGMGFDHIAAKNEKVTYQYLNVSDPLKKGSEDIFTVKFKVKGNINGVESLKNALKITNAVIQNGQKATSEKYGVDITYSVNNSVVKITDDDSIGEKVYNQSGDILTEDETKQIKENDSSVNIQTDSDTQDNHNDVSVGGNSQSGKNDSDVKNNSDVKNSETKKVGNVTIVVAVLIVLVIAVGVTCTVIKRRKTVNKNEE